MHACMRGYGIDAPIRKVSPIFVHIRFLHTLLVCIEEIPDVLGLFIALNILPKVRQHFLLLFELVAAC